MTDVHFYDENEEAPLPRSREDVRFEAVALKPYRDGRRVKLNFKLTPFVERPSVDMWVTNPSGAEVASMSLVEAMDTEFDFTIHLRGPQPEGEHLLRLVLFYLESDEVDAPRQVVDEHRLAFGVPPAA